MKSIFSKPATLGAVALCVLLSATLASRCIDGLNSPATLSLESQTALSVLPSDAFVLGKVNVQNLRDNSLEFADHLSIDEMLENVNTEINARFHDFVDETGFDPTQDMNSLYFAIPDESGNSPIVIMYGKLSTERLDSFIEENLSSELVRSNHGDIAYYTAADGDGFSFAFLNNEMVAASPSVESLVEVIDRMTGERTNQNGDISALLDRVSGHDAWFVASSIQNKLDEINASELDAGLQLAKKAINQIAVGFDVTADEIHLVSHLGPSDNISSSDLESIVKGAIATARTSVREEKPIVADMLDGVSVKSRDGMVVVSIDVSSEDIQAIESTMHAGH